MVLTFTESEFSEKLTKKVNTELRYVKRWLDANTLSLNVKANCIIFHSPGNKLPLLIKTGSKLQSKIPENFLVFIG